MVLERKPSTVQRTAPLQSRGRPVLLYTCWLWTFVVYSCHGSHMSSSFLSFFLPTYLPTISPCCCLALSFPSPRFPTFPLLLSPFPILSFPLSFSSPSQLPFPFNLTLSYPPANFLLFYFFLIYHTIYSMICQENVIFHLQYYIVNYL